MDDLLDLDFLADKNVLFNVETLMILLNPNSKKIKKKEFIKNSKINNFQCSVLNKKENFYDDQ